MFTIALSVLMLLAPLLTGSLDWSMGGSIAGAALAVAAVQLLVWSRTGLSVRPAPVLWGLLAFTVTQAVSLVTSVDRGTTLRSILMSLAAAALALLAGSRSLAIRRGDHDSDAWCLLLPAGAMAAALAYIGLTGVREYALNYRFDPASRIFATFFNPDITAGFIGMALLVCLSLLWLDLGLVPTFCLSSAAVFGGAALALTGSKAGWLSFLIGLGAMAAVRLKTRPCGQAVRGSWFVPVLALCGLAAASLSKMLLQRIAEASTGEAHSMLFRALVWKSSLHMMMAHPLTGFGAGTYGEAYVKYAIAGPTMMAHSSFLQAGAEDGVPGLCLLAAAAVLAVGPAMSLCIRRSVCPLPAAPVADGGPAPETARIVAAALAPGLAGALAVSIAHNVIDFDWSVPGSWFTFWAAAGLLYQCVYVLSPREEASTPASGPSLTSGSRACLAAGVAAVIAAAACGASAAAEAYGTIAHAALGGGVAGDTTPADPARARDLASRAIQLDPLDGEYRETRANAEMRLSEGTVGVDPDLRRAAEEDLRRASRLMPASATSHWLLGRYEESLGDLSQAAREYRAALDRDPHILESDLRLAALAAARHSLDEARRWYSAVTAVESTAYAGVRGVPEEFDTRYLQAWVGLERVDTAAGRWASVAEDGEHALRDLEEYARDAKLHYRYDAIWTVYSRANREQTIGLVSSVVEVMETALRRTGRDREIPGIQARTDAIRQILTSIKEPRN